MLMLALSLLAPTAQAQEVRALHLSPDAPNVDIYVDNGQTPTVANLGYRDGTGYVSAPSGTVNFKVTVQGTPAAAAVLDFDLDLDPGVRYSAVAFGTLANLAPMALVDDRSGIDPGSVRFQISHAADGIDDVNVFVLGAGEVASDVSYGSTFSADLPSAPYSVGLDTDLDQVPDWRFEVPELPGGSFVNVFAAIDSDGPYLLAWLDDGSTVRLDGTPVEPAGVRAVHLSPDAPNVDIYIDGALSVEDLAFGEVAGWLEVPRGRYRVRVVETGTTGPAVIDRGFILTDGKDVSITAFGNLSDIEATKFAVGNCPATAAEVCIQAFHAADGVGTVDLWDLSSGTQIVDGLPYGGRGNVLAAAGSFVLGLDADGDGTPDFSFDIPDLGGAQNMQVYAVLDAQGAPFLQVVFDDNAVAQIPAN